LYIHTNDCQLHGLLYHLKFNTSKDLLTIIHKFKTILNNYYNQHIPNPHVNRCVVLGCYEPTHVTVNQMAHCHTHRGLVLFNGLRHHSARCTLLNALCYKQTGEDWGHCEFLLFHIEVPIDEKMTGPMNVRMERFCGDRLDRKTLETQKEPVFIGHNRYTYVSTKHGGSRRVPANSWVYLGRTDLVVSWIKMEHQDARDGTWHSVKRMDQLFDLLDRVGRLWHPGEGPTRGDGSWRIMFNPRPSWCKLETLDNRKGGWIGATETKVRGIGSMHKGYGSNQQTEIPLFNKELEDLFIFHCILTKRKVSVGQSVWTVQLPHLSIGFTM
jgi:hypothetical protein